MPDRPAPFQRNVTAPSPSAAKILPNRVFSVVLEADEDVEWSWTHTADGVSYVSGYSLIKKAVIKKAL